MRSLLWIGVMLVALAGGTWVYLTIARTGVTVPAVHGSISVVENPHASRAAWRLVPLPNAQIRVEWSASVDAFVDRGHACIRGLTTRTSRDGGFEIPSWTASPGVDRVTWRAYLLEPGYQTVEDDQDPSQALPGFRHQLIVRRVGDNVVSWSGPATGEFECWKYPPRD